MTCSRSWSLKEWGFCESMKKGKLVKKSFFQIILHENLKSLTFTSADVKADVKQQK